MYCHPSEDGLEMWCRHWNYRWAPPFPIYKGELVQRVVKKENSSEVVSDERSIK